MWFGVSSATAFAAAAAWILFMHGEESRETQYISYEATAFQFGRCNGFSHNNPLRSKRLLKWKVETIFMESKPFQDTNTHTRGHMS